VERFSFENGEAVIEGRDGSSIKFNPYKLAYGSEIEALVREHIQQARRKHAKEFGTEETATQTPNQTATVYVADTAPTESAVLRVRP
jgi:hypothetical protein